MKYEENMNSEIMIFQFVVVREVGFNVILSKRCRVVKDVNNKYKRLWMQMGKGN